MVMISFFPPYLLFPLGAAMIYAVGSLSLRAASTVGSGPWRATCMTNLLAATMFLFYVEGWPNPDLPLHWWSVIGLGGLFFLGNVLTVLSLSVGDVSIAAPVLAAKVVMVVALMEVTGLAPATWTIWLAGFMTIAGVLFLQRSTPTQKKEGRGVLTLCLSLGAAACFAFFDVGVQVVSARDGFHRVAPYAVGVAGAISGVLLPFVMKKEGRVQRKGLRYLWIGVGLLSFQSFILIYALGKFNDAAGINIVYGSRGLWGLVAVSLLGRFFLNREREEAGAFFRYRLAGAVCIAGAIFTSLA